MGRARVIPMPNPVSIKVDAKINEAPMNPQIEMNLGRSFD